MMCDTFQIELLNTSHDRKKFDCGNASLNCFLMQYARQNQQKNIGKTYVVNTKNDQKTIAGFYTLSSGQINCDALPASSRHPNYPVAIARIARLAVSKDCQNKGLGGFLLFDALNKIKLASNIIGIHAVVVDAKNASAKSFYEHYGFEVLQNKELTLFLPMQTILEINKK